MTIFQLEGGEHSHFGKISKGYKEQNGKTRLILGLNLKALNKKNRSWLNVYLWTVEPFEICSIQNTVRKTTGNREMTRFSKMAKMASFKFFKDYSD